MELNRNLRNRIQVFAMVAVAALAFGAPARANVRVRPSSLSFGTQAVGTAGTQTVTITNNNWHSVTLSGALTTAPQFSFSGQTFPVTLNPGQSFTGRVTFNPSAAQSYSARLEFTRTNQSWFTASVSLSGTGVQSSTPPPTSPTPETINAIAGLSFSGTAGSALASQAFSVGTTSPSSATFTVTTDQAWLSIVSASGTTAAGNSVVVSAKTTGLSAGTFTGHVIVTVPNQGGFTFTNSPYSVPVTLTVTSATVAPTITTQPASQKITTGQSATFNVASTGTAPMNYQWKKNGAMISGATASTYTTPAETMTDNNAQFTVTVSNTAGSATSNAAVLTVASSTVAPAITTQPASASIVAGNTASFSVAASGTSPFTYQWSKNGAAISGATSATYTTPAETTTDNNAKFTVTVTNSAGSATSNAATLTVSASSVLLNSSVSSVAFGSVNVSGSASQTVTLTNAGTANVTISNVTVSGAGFNASGVSSGLILTPGQKATLTATFSPAAAGSASGSVSVASNATNSPDAISLSGTGVAVSHAVALSWTASTSSVAGYNTYSSTVSGGPYTKMTNSPLSATSYTDSAVLSGQTYFFVVTSVDTNNVESTFSNEVSALIP